EVTAVLGFDTYPDVASRLQDVIAGRPVASHEPIDRRQLLPVAPVHRPVVAAELGLSGHNWVPRARKRLDASPVAYLKLASGCDRRCSFCAIPSFRGSFVSRPADDVLAEGRWVATTRPRGRVSVIENS